MRSFVRCPTCRQKLLLASDREGQRRRCPRCSTRFVVGNPLSVVDGLVEYLGFELFDQDPVDEIEVLDDGPDEIEVLDNPPTGPAAAPEPATVGAAEPEPPKPKKRKKRPGRRQPGDVYPDDEYDDGAYDDAEEERWANVTGDYTFDPRDRRRWNLVQWGVTLVLIPLLLFLASFVLSFSSLFVGMGSGLEVGWSILGGGILTIACDGLRLAGYILCLYVPGKPINRIWVIIAIVMSFGGGAVLVVPIVAAEAIGQLAVVLALFGIGITIGMCGWGAYLMFLEGVAEMFNERGIADSVSALIKLGTTYMVCVLILYGTIVTMVAIHTGTQGVARADPSDIVVGICWCIMCAFTAILGLVVFIKYILVLLNIRAMIDWCT